MRRVESVLDVLVPSLRLIISGYWLPAEFSAVWAYIPKLNWVSLCWQMANGNKRCNERPMKSLQFLLIIACHWIAIPQPVMRKSLQSPEKLDDR